MTMQEEDTIKIDKRLAKELLWHLEFVEDEGPQEEGWKSDELLCCIQQLKDALQRPLCYA